MKNRK